MKLFYQIYPDSQDLAALVQPPVLIIPGLFGSTINWRSFARELSKTYPVIVIDQRNHGRSPHTDTQSYFDMSDDVLELLDTLALDKVALCGHSMGGKTAMVFSLLHPERVSKLVILDIIPRTYTHSHAPFLDALLQIDLSQLGSRSDADKALRSAIPDTGTRLFLLQSLTGNAKNYQWRLNLSVLQREMQKIVGFPSDELEGCSNSVETTVIFGDNSTYVKGQDLTLLTKFFPQADLTSISNAGHWLHVEQPKLVLDALQTFLQKK